MTHDEMLQRNIDLETAFGQYVLEHPEILDTLPKDFQLLILPDDDPELARRNQELLEQQNFGKPIVVVRMTSTETSKLRIYPPNAPVLLTA